MAKYHVENFGCRTSQADGDAIATALDGLGAHPADGLRHGDVVIVNTCTVTAEADRDARAYIRRAQRANPNSRIVVTGCYAQRAPAEIAALPGVFAVVGNSHKNQVASIAVGDLVLSVPKGDDLAFSGQTAGPSTPSAVADFGLDDKLIFETAFSFGGGFVPLTSLQMARPLDVAPTLLLSGDIYAHSEFQLPSFPASVVHRSALDPNAARRTRPTLKIQDGCGNRCTFCVIPSTRGNSRSLPKQQVLAAVKEFVDAGGNELVVSGINLGRWGRDLTPQTRFEDLLAEIFETTALPRLRISSVEPMDWTDGLIALFVRWGAGEHPRFARHAHVPLQSGADRVLRRMHRRYRPWHYAERLARIRSASPEAAIGADVMVGFPGETDLEFRESYDFIAAQPLTYLHLFPFSARPGTPGWELHRRNPVPGTAAKERMAALRALIDQKNQVFRSSFIGKQISAVTLISSETVTASRNSSVLTDNFLPVELDGMWPANMLLPVQITGLTATGISGTVPRANRLIA